MQASVNHMDGLQSGNNFDRMNLMHRTCNEQHGDPRIAVPENEIYLIEVDAGSTEIAEKLQKALKRA